MVRNHRTSRMHHRMTRREISSCDPSGKKHACVRACVLSFSTRAQVVRGAFASEREKGDPIYLSRKPPPGHKLPTGIYGAVAHWTVVESRLGEGERTDKTTFAFSRRSVLLALYMNASSRGDVESRRPLSLCDTRCNVARQ